jgi:hypothetical protein
MTGVLSRAESGVWQIGAIFVDFKGNLVLLLL